MSCSCLLSAGARSMQARFGVANGLEAFSNTMNVRPHEFLDHTTFQSLYGKGHRAFSRGRRRAKNAQTATANRESGRDISCRVPLSSRSPRYVLSSLHTSIGPDIEARVLP